MRAALLALLDWYAESGVDLALDDAPHDRYADSARAAPEAAAAPAPLPRQAPAPSPKSSPSPSPRPQPAARRAPPVVAAPDEAARAAEAAAASAQSLDELSALLANFPHAPFRDMARHFLFAAGTPGAPLMALDAAPGATEESTGEAFAGREARLLDNMLAAIGADRKGAYLAYVAPWRPAGDRPLTPQEAAVFAPFARRHVELARPKVLLLFGDAPARAMLQTSEPLAKLRGRAFDIRCGAHLAQGFVFNGLDRFLNTWTLKPAAWRDLRAAAAALGR